MTTVTTHDTSADATWDLEPLVDGEGEAGVDRLLGQAASLVASLQPYRGRIAELDAGELADLLTQIAAVSDALGRAGSYAGLRFAADTSVPAHGALQQRVQERTTAISNDLVFVDLEWADVDDDRAEALLTDDRLAFARHHLRRLRVHRPHLLSEAEERLDAEKDVTGRAAWARLFTQLTAAITCDVPNGEGGTTRTGLDSALTLLQAGDRDVRRQAADAITAGLAPGLSTRAYVLNTILADHATGDRLRSYASWISRRNLANEASDASVDALVEAVRRRYELPQRWYRLKAAILGLDRLADYDRLAPVAVDEHTLSWDEAVRLVLDAYRSFSPELADIAGRFVAERWIDAPVRPGKAPGAFCAYTVPSHHPYVLLNWTGHRHDALTLAHELGHGLHAYLARPQGIFHAWTPLTVAETASVFGETVTFGRLLEQASGPADRLSLLAGQLDGAVATVFRQIAMNRFEHAVHTHRREVGELSVDDLAEAWAATQAELLGESVEITPGYRTWWSYISHFVGTPGYVYAYAYGQLLALAVFRRYEEEGEAFVPRYLDLLATGGSRPPEELGGLVGIDLADPGFWDGGLRIIEEQLDAAEWAARDAGFDAV